MLAKKFGVLLGLVFVMFGVKFAFVGMLIFGVRGGGSAAVCLSVRFSTLGTTTVGVGSVVVGGDAIAGTSW